MYMRFLPLLVLLFFQMAYGFELDEIQRRAEAGEAWFQLNLGASYDHGLKGQKKNPELAVYWYRKAALQGVAEAQFNLAHCLATGAGVERDLQKARFWMKKAASKNMADAQFLYAVLLAEGRGGKPDISSSKLWLRRAAAQGNQNAKHYLQSLE